jgi:5-methylcytosine-specific restriction endonuclease McrA
MSVYAKEYNQRPEVKAKHSIQVADRERWEGVSLACMGEEDKAKTVAIYMERDRLNKDLGHAGYHVDHILPKALGGDHIWFNMQILTAQENLSKNAQFRAKDKDLYQQRIAQLFI